MRAIILALALAGCANAPPPELPAPVLPERAGVDPIVAARAEGIAFRAVGEGFVLDIFHEDRIRLTLTATGEELIFPKPEPRYPAWNGSIYDTQNDKHGLYIEIRDDRPCERGVPRVDVGLGHPGDAREFTGCGRSF